MPLTVKGSELWHLSWVLHLGRESASWLETTQAAADLFTLTYFWRQCKNQHYIFSRWLKNVILQFLYITKQQLFSSLLRMMSYGQCKVLSHWPLKSPAWDPTRWNKQSYLNLNYFKSMCAYQDRICGFGIPTVIASQLDWTDFISEFNGKTNT